jgi:GT2 family glycosyltransferase
MNAEKKFETTVRTDLKWGLIVCTYNRKHFLMKCLKHTLSQSRPPSEVVIVDASDYWQDTLNEVMKTYKDFWKEIRLVYEPAKVRSSAHQRNQALDLSQSDVIFSLDDDIYMHPNSADTIMDAYERDVDEEIALIGGHFVDSNPDEKELVPAESSEAEHTSLVGRIRTNLEQQLSLDAHFVPYDKPVNRMDPPPKSTHGLEVFPSGLVSGGRTTFRRRYGIQVHWSPLLRYYATHEDSDFSYRMSHHGRILVAPKAAFFHADGNERRLNRFKVNTIRVRNLMALHRVSSTNRLRSSCRLLASFCFFIGLYLLIDPARKRFSFPIVRAYALGAALIPVFMFFPFRDFSAWYLDQQERMHSAR